MLRRSGIMLLLITLPACGDDWRTNEMINGGGSSASDGMWVSAPSLFLRRDFPAIMVGMVQPPGKPRAYAYVFVIKGDEQRKTFAQFKGQSRAVGTTTAEGATATSTGSLAIGSQQVTFEYRFQDSTTTIPDSAETLIVNGKAVDLTRGRIILLDLSPQGGKLQQVQAQLPASPTWPVKTDTVTLQAKELLRNLKLQSNDVRDFLK